VDPFGEEQVEADFHKINPFWCFDEVGEAWGGGDGANYQGGIFPWNRLPRGRANIAGYVRSGGSHWHKIVTFLIWNYALDKTKNMLVKHC
jgi:hypothetical protein